jgi:cytochrome b pre-mRNA-processing protein 3
MLERLRARFARRDRAIALYDTLVGQARRPAFYRDLGVPDTLDGRFDMIVLHAFMVLRRLRGAGPEGVALGQAVFEVMFADMDQNLRQIGVGDLGVGRRVKAMTRAFMGRVGAYDLACREGPPAIAAALARNVFRSEVDVPAARALAAYVAASGAMLAALDDRAVMDGALAFATPDAAP